MAAKNEVELELHELSEDDDEGFDYGGVVLGEDELLFDANDSLDGGFALGDGADEDLETTLRSLRQHAQHEHGAAPPSPQSPKLLAAAAALALEEVMPETTTLPCVIDDFLRNFFIEAGMVKTLEVFDCEWYSPDLGLYSATDPDIYQQNASLKQSIDSCRVKMGEMAATTDKATGTWDAFRKERDFHRLYHKKVLREKKALMREMAELKVHFASEGPMIEKLTSKREGAMKDKMLLRLESDRLKAKARQLEEEIATITGDGGGGGGGGAKEGGAAAWGDEDSAADDAGGAAEKRASRMAGSTKRGRSSTQRGTQSLSATLAGLRGVPNRFADVVFEPVAADRFMQNGTIDGHRASVAAAAFHPRKAVLCTASDDMSWRMWKLPEGTALMSGKGHTDWVSDIAFHPEGDSLASASGDGDVRIWDFKQGKCAGVLKGHSRAVWSIAYHHTGDFLASASMDHSLKLWDLGRQQCAMSLRGHVDSVNSVCFKPFSSTVCSASGDKTVSLWDARSGLCSHTFYGHANAVNHCAFQLNGTSLACFVLTPHAPSRRCCRGVGCCPPPPSALLRV